MVWGVEGLPGAGGEESRSVQLHVFVRHDRRAGSRKGVKVEWGFRRAQDAALPARLAQGPRELASHVALTCRGFKGPVALRSWMPRHLPDSCTPSTPRPPGTCCPRGPALLPGSLPPPGQHLAGTAPTRGGWWTVCATLLLSYALPRLFYEDLRNFTLATELETALQGGPISGASLKGQLRL